MRVVVAAAVWFLVAGTSSQLLATAQDVCAAHPTAADEVHGAPNNAGNVREAGKARREMEGGDKDVAGLSVGELKKLIKAAGLPLADCVEKSDLVARAREAQKLAQQQQPPAQPDALVSKEATVGGLDCTIVAPRSVLEGGAQPDVAVVLLHGYGATKEDFAPLPRSLQGQLGTAKVGFVFPQAPDRGSYGEPQWWQIDVQKWVTSMQTGAVAQLIRQPPKGLDACRQQLLAFVRTVRHDVFHGVPASRVVLSGFSQGAMTATDVALSLPREEGPGGLLVLSGAPIVVEEWAAKLKTCARMKTLMVHGRQDAVLPFVASTWVRELLEKGGLEVDMVEHGGGHELGGAHVLRKIALFLRSLAEE